MTIGALAKRIGVAPSKLRYLEGEGLIKPERLPNGYRSYSEASVILAKTILQAQSLGFTLAEISAAFVENGAGELRCDLAIEKLRFKLKEVELHMERLRNVRLQLHQTMKQLEERRRGGEGAAVNAGKGKLAKRRK